MKKVVLFLTICVCVFLMITSQSSCAKDSDDVPTTITVTDTLIITESDTIFIDIIDTIILTDTINLTEYIHDTTTTFFVVRHAEKESSGSDPILTESGMERAMKLNTLLQNVSLSGVYSTDFNRTKQTAEPTSDGQMLPIVIYDPFNLNALIGNVLSDHFGKSVLVVGHSNTTPSLLNILLGTNTFPNIPEDEYDNLFIVSVVEKGNAKVLHLKY